MVRDTREAVRVRKQDAGLLAEGERVHAGGWIRKVRGGLSERVTTEVRPGEKDARKGIEGGREGRREGGRGEKESRLTLEQFPRRTPGCARRARGHQARDCCRGVRRRLHRTRHDRERRAGGES